MPADARPEKSKTLKPWEIRPAPVLNLGGSPATAPGKHYALQLNGGTNPDELYRTAQRHKLTNYLVYETERHGQRWYVLVGRRILYADGGKSGAEGVTGGAAQERVVGARSPAGAE